MARNWLKDLCQKEGVRQVELSERSGVGYSTINKIYNNHRTVSPTTKAKVVKALNDLSKNSYSIEEVFDDRV